MNLSKRLNGMPLGKWRNTLKGSMEMTYKQIRQDAGLSISEMAAYLAVDERTVRRYEDGTRTPGGPVNKLYGLLTAKKKIK